MDSGVGAISGHGAVWRPPYLATCTGGLERVLSAEIQKLSGLSGCDIMRTVHGGVVFRTGLGPRDLAGVRAADNFYAFIHLAEELPHDAEHAMEFLSALPAKLSGQLEGAMALHCQWGAHAASDGRRCCCGVPCRRRAWPGDTATGSRHCLQPGGGAASGKTEWAGGEGMRGQGSGVRGEGGGGGEGARRGEGSGGEGVGERRTGGRTGDGAWEEQHSFRVTCSRVSLKQGKHKFTSPEAAGALGEGLQALWGWPVSMRNFNVEVLGRIRDSELLLFLSLIYSFPDGGRTPPASDPPASAAIPGSVESSRDGRESSEPGEAARKGPTVASVEAHDGCTTALGSGSPHATPCGIASASGHSPGNEERAPLAQMGEAQRCPSSGALPLSGREAQVPERTREEVVRAEAGVHEQVRNEKRLKAESGSHSGSFVHPTERLQSPEPGRGDDTGSVASQMPGLPGRPGCRGLELAGPGSAKLLHPALAQTPENDVAENVCRVQGHLRRASSPGKEKVEAPSAGLKAARVPGVCPGSAGGVGRQARSHNAERQLYAWRCYRRALVSTSLKPSTAFALLQLAQVRPGHIILDPMCGCGTIPLEAADWLGASVFAVAGDMDECAVNAARENAAGSEEGNDGSSKLVTARAGCPGEGQSSDAVMTEGALLPPLCCSPGSRRAEGSAESSEVEPQVGSISMVAEESVEGVGGLSPIFGRKKHQMPYTSRCDVVQWSAMSMPWRSGTIDRVVCDMPFGNRCGTFKTREKLCPVVVGELARVLVPGSGRAVLLAQSRGLKQVLTSPGPVAQAFLVEEHIVADMEGLRVDVFVLQRTDASAPAVAASPCQNGKAFKCGRKAG